MTTYTLYSIGGAYPTQALGNLTDGRAFYFRARDGVWTLDISADKEIVEDWAGEDGEVCHHGDDPTHGIMSNAEVVKILDEYLS